MTVMELSRPQAELSFRNTVGAAGVVGLAALAILAALAPTIAPHLQGALNLAAPMLPPSTDHLFGTDGLGRDVWSETLYGLGVTMADAGVGFVMVLTAGSALGFLTAHALARWGFVARLAVDVLIAIPALLTAILVSSLMGQGHAAIAAGLAAAPSAFARAYDRARTQLSSPSADFARATGIDELALFRRDFVCEVREAFLPTAARAYAAVTITLATMSFFGFGAVAPARDLGLLVAANQGALPNAWWSALFPTLALALVILCARLAARLSGGERP